jgi:major vault protein
MSDEYEGRTARGGNQDLVLVPGEYAYILDNTKGNVNVVVGPNKTSLSATDSPVKWNSEKRRFLSCSIEEAKQVYPNASEGFYVVLQGPVSSGAKEHPQSGTSSNMADLQIGRTINIPGPANFPLWPGQTAKVIPGHRLRSNQYLVGRVYNDDEAEKNWERAVVKPQTTSDDEQEQKDLTPGEEAKSSVAKPDRITMGQLIIIKGTDVSFYIPPTGIEVVPDDRQEFVVMCTHIWRFSLEWENDYTYDQNN